MQGCTLCSHSVCSANGSWLFFNSQASHHVNTTEQRLKVAAVKAWKSISREKAQYLVTSMSSRLHFHPNIKKNPYIINYISWSSDSWAWKWGYVDNYTVILFDSKTQKQNDKNVTIRLPCNHSGLGCSGGATHWIKHWKITVSLLMPGGLFHSSNVHSPVAPCSLNIYTGWVELCFYSPVSIKVKTEPPHLGQWRTFELLNWLLVRPG